MVEKDFIIFSEQNQTKNMDRFLLIFSFQNDFDKYM